MFRSQTDWERAERRERIRTCSWYRCRRQSALHLLIASAWCGMPFPRAHIESSACQPGKQLVGLIILLPAHRHRAVTLPRLWCFKDPLFPLRGLPTWRSGKESACQCWRAGSIPGSGRAPGGGNGNLLQYSYLENSMDRGAWQATVHGVAKSQTRLSTANTLPSWNWVQNSPDLSNRPSISFPPSFDGASPRCHSLTTGPWNSGPSSVDKGMAVPSLLNTTEVFTTFPSKSAQAVRTGCGDSKEGWHP